MVVHRANPCPIILQVHYSVRVTWTFGEQNNGITNVCILNSKAHEYVVLHGKGILHI